MRVGGAQVAQQLLEVALVRVRVAVQAEEVDLGAGTGAAQGLGNGRPVGVLVSV